MPTRRGLLSWNLTSAMLMPSLWYSSFSIVKMCWGGERERTGKEEREEGGWRDGGQRKGGWRVEGWRMERWRRERSVSHMYKIHTYSGAHVY